MDRTRLQEWRAYKRPYSGVNLIYGDHTPINTILPRRPFRERSHGFSDATSIGLGLRRAVAALSARKIDAGPLLERVALSGCDLSDRDLIVPAAAEARLIEVAAQAAGDAVFGIRMAEGADPRDAGLLYYLFNASATLRQALTLLSRYLPVANATLRLSVTPSPNGDVVAELMYRSLSRGHLKHAVEYQLAAVVRLLREISGRPVSPTRVTFIHHRSVAVREVERYFGCSAEFGGPADQLDFSRDMLEAPVVYADARLFEILKPYVEGLAAQRGQPSAPIRVAVENEIHKLLPYGQARIEAIARALGVSSRTLARRLAEENTTFSDILDDLRHALSLEYLAEPMLGVDRITALLGYGDAGSFSHAFRRWTGATPSQARADPAVRAKLARATKA